MMSDMVWPVEHLPSALRIAAMGRGLSAMMATANGNTITHAVLRGA